MEGVFIDFLNCVALLYFDKLLIFIFNLLKILAPFPFTLKGTFVPTKTHERLKLRRKVTQLCEFLIFRKKSHTTVLLFFLKIKSSIHILIFKTIDKLKSHTRFI